MSLFHDTPNHAESTEALIAEAARFDIKLEARLLGTDLRGNALADWTARDPEGRVYLRTRSYVAARWFVAGVALGRRIEAANAASGSRG